METRAVPAVTTFFDAAEHTLGIVGTADADACVITRGNNGAILVNGAATGAKLDNTDAIEIFTGDSNDAITLDFANGLFIKPNGDEVKIQVDGGGPGNDSAS